MTHKTGLDLLEEARQRVREMPPGEALAIHRSGGGTVFLDVRDPNEVNLGRIPGALHISRGNLEKSVEAMVPRDASVIVYCASGNRSTFAADTLQQMGYANVASMDGGIRGWMDAGGEIG